MEKMGKGEKLLNNTGKHSPMSMQGRSSMGSWKRERETCREPAVRMGKSQRYSSWPKGAWGPSVTPHTDQRFWKKCSRTWSLRVGSVEMPKVLPEIDVYPHAQLGKKTIGLWPWVNPLTWIKPRNMVSQSWMGHMLNQDKISFSPTLLPTHDSHDLCWESYGLGVRGPLTLQIIASNLCPSRLSFPDNLTSYFLNPTLPQLPSNLELCIQAYSLDLSCIYKMKKWMEWPFPSHLKGIYLLNQ